MKYFDLSSQYNLIKKSLNKDLSKIFYKTNFINGDEVSTLESKLSNYTNTYSLTCANGTDAIYLALLALNIKRGDFVICSNFNYISAAECCKLLGLKLILVDIDKSLNICPEKLSEAITNCKKKNIKPKLLISVNLFGNSINYSKINKILKSEEILHISDCAQSFGSTYKSKKLEEYAFISTTSFFPSKSLGCYGDGGAVFTKSKKIFNLIKSIKSHGSYKKKYNFKYVGLNSRLDTLQAAVLINKLKLLDKEIKTKNKNYKYFVKKLSNTFELQKLQNDTYSCHSYLNLYTNNISRNHILKSLKKNNIPYQIYYPKTVIEQLPYSDSIYFDLENSINISKKIFSIPFHPYIKRNDIDKILDTLNYL